MKRAAMYYKSRVASHGGYVYYYSLDLKQRWGEGRASADTIFVQPPGTPTVGMAYLRAYAATGGRFYLDAARETATALVRGQLQSGGWTQVIHFAMPERGRLGKYRKMKGGKWNFSSLDDNQTQAALRFLTLTDQALKFKDETIHDAALFGLGALLKAQFPNGAFPQGWDGPAGRHAVSQARYPDYDWRIEGRIKNYWDYYTLNDDLPVDVCETLIVAHEVYRDGKYLSALKRLGDFLILAQMPDPQPAWCQQYNYDMIPIWARKFEPPAISGSESQGALETLIRIARVTGDEKYLKPVPRALKYLHGVRLPDGRLARYYELKSNRPLYMTREYRLTYSDAAAPRHYGWKVKSRLEAIAARYKRAAFGITELRPGKPSAGAVRRVIMALGDQGRWVSRYAGERLVGQPKFQPGFRYLSSETFGKNLNILSDYLAGPR